MHESGSITITALGQKSTLPKTVILLNPNQESSENTLKLLEKHWPGSALFLTSDT